MFHLAAYTESIDNTANVDIDALTDDVLTVVSGHFQLRRAMELIMAYSSAPNLLRSRLDSPTLRLIANPHIRPFNAALLPANDPNVMELLHRPLRLPAGEELAVQTTNGVVGPERTYTLIWLRDRIDPLPQGDQLWARVTSTTAATANVWSTLAYTFDQNLPVGEYALVGSEHVSTNAIAHRWIFDDSIYRPGFLSTAAVGNRTHRVIYEHALGQWGRFMTTSLPRLQVLANGADAAHTVWMSLVRLPGVRVPFGI